MAKKKQITIEDMKRLAEPIRDKAIHYEEWELAVKLRKNDTLRLDGYAMKPDKGFVNAIFKAETGGFYRNLNYSQLLTLTSTGRLSYCFEMNGGKCFLHVFTLASDD